MSEEPMEDPQPEEAPEAEAEATTEAPASPAEGTFTVRALIVGGVTFVAVLGMVIAIYVFSAPTGDPPGKEIVPEPRTRDEVPAEGGFVIVTLLQNYQFTTTLPPTGDRSITYKYSITLKVIKSRRPSFDELIDPEKRNMMPLIKETIRKIIGSEDYLKLRSEKLEGVKRRIKQKLNALMDSEVVDDVIFERWDIIP